MPRTSKNYEHKITLQVTAAMLADLDVIAAKSRVPRAEVIRQAVRAALDYSDQTLGTKRRFDNRFQARFDQMEKHLEETLKRFLASMQETYVPQVVQPAVAEIKRLAIRQQSEDAEKMLFYLSVIAMLNAKLLWQTSPGRNRPESPLDVVTEAIEAARGDAGLQIRDQIRGRR